MSVYPNKLTVIYGDKTVLCPVYSTEAEATPLGGKALKVGVIVGDSVLDGYMGLTSSLTPTSAPLRTVIDGVDYYFSSVEGGGGDKPKFITIRINPTENQTIRFTCNGATEFVTVEPKEFTVPYGAEYSIKVIPDEGYDAGKLNVPETGVITESLDVIKVEEATLKQIPITITQPQGATLTVNGHTTTFNANYGDDLVYTVTYAPHFSSGKVEVVKTGTDETYIGAKITTPLTLTVTGILEDAKYRISIFVDEHITSFGVTAGGKAINNGDTVYSGTTIEVTAQAETGYADPTITFS